VNPNLTSLNPAAKANGLADLVARGGLWKEQVLAMGLTLILAIVATTVIAFALKATLGLRPTTEVERQGLDITEHQEDGYIM
jgi:Amt family ammonium transporter